MFVDGVVTVKSGSTVGRSSINPGVHWMCFTDVGDPDVEQELVIHAGEKVRPVEVRVGSKPEAAVAVPPPLHEGSEGHGFRFPILAGVSFGVERRVVHHDTSPRRYDGERREPPPRNLRRELQPVRRQLSQQTRIVVANVAMGLGIATAVAGAATLLVVNLTRSGDAERGKLGSADGPSPRAGPGSLLLVGTF